MDDLTARRRTAIAVVGAPGALLVGALAIVIALGNLTDSRGIAGVTIEFNAVSFFAAVLGSALLFASIMGASMETFATDQRRNGPIPLTVAGSTAAAVIVSTLMPMTASTWTSLLPTIPAALLAGFGGFAAACRILPSLDLPQSAAPAPPGALRRRPTGVVVWSGQAARHDLHTFTRPIALIGLLYAVLIGAVLAKAGWSSDTARLLLTALAVNAAFPLRILNNRVRLTAGPGGFTIRNRLQRRTLYHVELGNIESAWFTDAPRSNPMWGDYGKQSSRKRLAFLTRGGPALMVKLTDGSDIVVSLDEPQEAAAAINDLLDRRARVPDPTGRRPVC